MIIGISGKIGAGKDTLAECIQEIDPNFQNKKFAYKLKKIAELLTGVSDQWTQPGKECYLHDWNMTIREIQQRLGTNAIRKGLHEDAWVLALFADWESYKYIRWIVTDVRFPNEVEAIKKRNGFLVRIDGSRNPQIGTEAQHPSETSLDNYTDFDYRFDNTHLTLNELRNHAWYVWLNANKKAGNNV